MTDYVYVFWVGFAVGAFLTLLAVLLMAEGER